MKGFFFYIYNVFFGFFVKKKTCAVSDCIIFPLQRKFPKIREMIKRTTFLKTRSVSCLFFIHQIDLNGYRGEFTFFHFSKCLVIYWRIFEMKKKRKTVSNFPFLFEKYFLIENEIKTLVFKKWNVFVIKVIQIHLTSPGVWIQTKLIFFHKNLFSNFRI